MADADHAIGFVLANEGGFVDNVNDSGGATNFGLSLRFLREVPIERLRKYGIFKNPEVLTTEDIKELTPQQANLIYKGEFWDSARFAEIVDEKVCAYVFDMGVNHGISQAIKLMQRAIWAMYQTINVVKDDGVLGDHTLHAVNYLGDHVVPCLMSERAGFMRLLVVKNSKDEEFINGWLNRCYRI